VPLMMSKVQNGATERGSSEAIRESMEAFGIATSVESCGTVIESRRVLAPVSYIIEEHVRSLLPLIRCPEDIGPGMRHDRSVVAFRV